MDTAGLTEQQRAVWRSGDYDEIAPTIEAASTELVTRIGVSEGHEVLDVACGTGNSAIPAARRGARVTGLDLTPELLEIARERAASAGVEIELVEGDAGAMPFADGSFDLVLSVFGVMFAPDQPAAAGELLRVCRPGGRIGVCAWTPEGVNGRFFAVLGAHLPPPPSGFTPATLWGTEARVRELFAGTEVEFERLNVVKEYESVDAWVEFHARSLPPLMAAKPALEAAGRWERTLDDIRAHYEGANEATDGSMRIAAEYLLSVVTVPS